LCTRVLEAEQVQLADEPEDGVNERVAIHKLTGVYPTSAPHASRRRSVTA
jgi:hypothetical protein